MKNSDIGTVLAQDQRNIKVSLHLNEINEF